MSDTNADITNTPYDDVFRTLLTDCSQLIIPVINDVFGEHYPENAKIESAANEHFLNQQDGKQEERITDSCFRIMENPKKWYHIECQSTTDHSMIIRMFEYDAQIALTHHNLEKGILTVQFPESAVMLLRQNSKTPDTMTVRILTKGGQISYDIPLIKVQDYSLDEIFQKRLLFLIPFYIFRYEKQFAEIENSEQKQVMLKKDFARIQKHLTELTESGLLDLYDKLAIIEMTRKVVDHIAQNHPRLQEGVKNVMGGKILDYEAKRIQMEGEARGNMNAWIIGVKNIMQKFAMTADDAMNTLGVPLSEQAKLKKLL